MAMTELTLLFLGSLATLSTIGIFQEFDERWTQVLVTFFTAVLWGMFGLSSYDVVIDDAATVSEPIMPFVVLGIGLAAMITLLGFYQLLKSFGEETAESDLDMGI